MVARAARGREGGKKGQGKGHKGKRAKHMIIK